MEVLLLSESVVQWSWLPTPP